MANKTCGECRYLDKNRYCEFLDFEPKPQMKGCANFEPKPTNGDRIRQMSNKELAEMLVYPVKPMNINGNIHYEFTSCLLLGKSYPMREQAVFLTMKWLNAPAESEVNNG